MIDYVSREEDLISKIVDAYRQLKMKDPGHPLTELVRLTESGGINPIDCVKFTRMYSNGNFNYLSVLENYLAALQDASKLHAARYGQNLEKIAR